MYLNTATAHRSIFILSNQGEIISDIDNLNVRQQISDELGEKILFLGEPITTKEGLVYTSQLSNLWYLVSITDISATPQVWLNTYVLIYVSILMACIISTLAIVYVLSKYFMQPMCVHIR